MGVAAAVAARRRRKITGAFREAGALAAGKAVSRHELGLRSSAILRRLVRTGVLVDCGDGRYYLDEEAEARAHHMRVHRFTLLMTVLVLVLVAVWFAERS